MALYRNGRFEDDDWSFPPDDAPLPAAGNAAVPKARFLAARDALLGRDASANSSPCVPRAPLIPAQAGIQSPGLLGPRFRGDERKVEAAAHGSEIGLVLVAGDTLDGLVDDLPKLALVVIRFPKYSDGRPYSLARLLRDRHGFGGELRASGDVLRDQVALMLRAGFDALEVTHPGTIVALRESRIVAVHHHYQPASAEASETRPDTRPWRRVSAALS
jgi:uncharacterized protein (DUF934 family)